MQVITTRQFEKDTEKELNKKLQLQLADIIEQLQQADNLIEIPNVKKMKGYKNAYRIRFGELDCSQVIPSPGTSPSGLAETRRRQCTRKRKAIRTVWS